MTQLPSAVTARVSVEAGIALGWREIVGDRGRSVSIEHFGASADAETLGKALLAVLDGDRWAPDNVAGAAPASGDEQDAAARVRDLTPQQFRVLLCLADGLLNKQIAATLGLAENTVKVHVTAILKKLECYSRTQAAVLVKSLETEPEAAP